MQPARQSTPAHSFQTAVLTRRETGRIQTQPTCQLACRLDDLSVKYTIRPSIVAFFTKMECLVKMPDKNGDKIAASDVKSCATFENNTYRGTKVPLWQAYKEHKTRNFKIGALPVLRLSPQLPLIELCKFASGTGRSPNAKYNTVN